MSRFRSLVIFVLLVGIVTVIAGGIYVSVQQTYRNNANDPQIDAAEQIADLLSQGAPAQAILGQSSSVDIAKNLSLFIIIFDKDTKPVSASGKLNGQIPVPPKGVFDSLKNRDENKFTWEPEKGTRVAGVIRKASEGKGYVLAGRNLREVQKRVRQLEIIVGLVWFSLLILCALLTLVLSKLNSSLTLVENTEVINVQTKEDIK